jgi:AbrB family looped-hinge helix DNA binding protein
MTSTLTSKGQVTVPKKIRDYLGLQPGSTVAFSLGRLVAGAIGTRVGARWSGYQSDRLR